MYQSAYNATVLLLNGKLYDVLKAYFQRPDYLRLWFLPLYIFISRKSSPLFKPGVLSITVHSVE